MSSNNSVTLSTVNFYGLCVSILLLSFIQTGITFYISVQLFLFFLLSFNLKVFSLYTAFYKNIYVIVLVLFSMFFNVYSFEDIAQVLRVLLLMLYLYAFIEAANGLRINPSVMTANIKYLMNLVKVIILIQFFLVVIQAIKFSSGIYFGLPVDLYVINKSTLDNVGNAMYHLSRFRPRGTFAEPSYLTFIINLLMIIVVSYEKKKFIRNFYILVCFLISLLSGSMLGLIGFLVCVFFAVNSKVSIKTLIPYALLILFLLFFSAIVSDEFSQRLMLISSNEDRSMFFRLVLPFTMVGDVMVNSPFGVLDNQLAEYFSNLKFYYDKDVSRNTDNAFLNFILNFGWVGFFIIYSLKCSKYDKRILIPIVYSGFQNGSLFSFDKVVILSLYITLLMVIKNETAELKDASKSRI